MAGQTVAVLAELVGGRVVGDANVAIVGVAELGSAGPGEISFLRHARHVERARRSKASALLVGAELELGTPQIVVASPDAAFARIAARFHPVETAREHAVHPTAVVDSTAVLEPPVRVGPLAFVGAGARLGPGTVVHAGVVIGAGTAIGRECVLYPRVVLYDRVVLGDRVVVHGGTVVGADGFGYANEEGRWLKIPQIGTVVIEDDVEIGANCAIDRGSLGLTRIGRGTKLDNIVHVGHNCVLGEDNALAALCALAGSTATGRRVILGGHTVSGGHVRACDDVRIGGNSVLLRDVNEPGDYMGYPLMKKARWGRMLRIFDRLTEIHEAVRRVLWGK